jgi:hypothetical protein
MLSTEGFLFSITMVWAFPLTGWAADRAGWLASFGGAGMVVLTIMALWLALSSREQQPAPT